MSRTPPALYLVELTVGDWPAAVAWFGAVLDASPRSFPGREPYALFETAGGRVALKRGAPHPGGVLLALEVGDLTAELDRLAGRGIVPVEPPKVSAEGYRRAILRAPDGHRVSLFEWLPRPAAEPADPMGPAQSTNQQFSAEPACRPPREGL
jgi:predicted enzyme related to lactoylglutathione lyase